MYIEPSSLSTSSFYGLCAVYHEIRIGLSLCIQTKSRFKQRNSSTMIDRYCATPKPSILLPFIWQTMVQAVKKGDTYYDSLFVIP